MINFEFLAIFWDFCPEFLCLSLLGGFNHHQSREVAWGPGGAGREHHHRPDRQASWVPHTHSDIESEPDSQRRWFLAALVRTIPSIPRLQRPVSPATDSPEVRLHIVMVHKSASKSLVVPRLLCGPWVRVSVVPHLRRGWTGWTEQVGTHPRILMIIKIPDNFLERKT